MNEPILDYTPPALPRGTHCIEHRQSGFRVLETPGGLIETDEIRIDAQGKKHKVVKAAPYRLLKGPDRMHATPMSVSEAKERAVRWLLSSDEYRITML